MKTGYFRSKLLLIMVVMMASMLLLVACGGKQQTQQPAPAATTDKGDQAKTGQPPASKPAEQKKDPIKLGVVFGTTGAMAAFETMYQEGALLAIEEVNKNGGINGQLIEPVVYDHESNPETAIARVKKLVQVDKVTAIVGPGTSYIDNPVLPTVDELKVPSVVVSGGMHYMKPLPKYTFTVEDGGFFMAGGLGKYWKAKGIKNFVLLTTADSTGEGAIKELTAGMVDAQGIQMLAFEQRPGTDTEFTAAWTKLLAHKPEAVFIYGSSPAFVTPAFNNLVDLGWDGPIGYAGAARLTTLLKGFTKQAGKNYQMATFKARAYDQLKENDPAKAKVLDFVTKYKAKYNKEPELAANGYVAAMQIIDAIKAVGTDQDKIRDWLENMKGWMGATGLVYNRSATDHEGISINDKIIVNWDSDAGKFKLLGYVAD